MNESELQSRLELLIGEGAFLKSITNRDAPTKALKHSMSNSLLPPFPTDYLSRLRVAEAADYVLECCGKLECVATNRNNISRTKGELLFSDLLYCNTEYGVLFLFELKRGTQTPRQTVTELLAYEHEVLNYLPFTDHGGLVMVVVATDFTPLLDHALVGLMTWGQRKILCLKAAPRGQTLELSVHLPSAWSMQGQMSLPHDAISTADLCAYPRGQMKLEDTQSLILTAKGLIVREAERAGSHGFVMVWEDMLYPSLSSCPFVITVGVMNPFSFMQDAVTRGLQVADATVFARYLLEGGRSNELASARHWLEIVGRRAIEYLQRWCNPIWEGFSTWLEVRQPDRVDGPAITMERRALPFSCDFWGVLGDYSREIASRTELRENFMPDTVKPGLDWMHPRLAIPLIDGIALPEPVRAGEWRFGEILQLGLQLGRYASLLETHRGVDASQKCKVEVMLFWTEMDLRRLLIDVRYRYLSTDEIREPPPTLSLGNYLNVGEILRQVNDLAKWISGEFIGNRDSTLAEAFSLGLRSCSFYDALFTGAENAQIQTQTRPEIAEAARRLLTRSLESILIEGCGPTARDELRSILKHTFSTSISETPTVEELRDVIATVEEKTLIIELPKAITTIVELWCPQLAHRLQPIAPISYDWDWIASQVAEMQKNSVSAPGLWLTPSGDLRTVDLSQNQYLRHLPQIPNPDTHVHLVIGSSIVESIEIVTWDALRAGYLNERRSWEGA